MEYKYYKYEGDGYVLQKPMGFLYFSIVVFLLLAALGLWYYLDKHASGGLLWFVCCLVFAGWPYYRQKMQVICLQTSTRLVQVKRGSVVKKQYPFSEYMNAKITRVRVNGITSQYQASIFMNDNGKNRTLLLGIVLREKIAQRLIAETEAILSEGLQSTPNNTVNINGGYNKPTSF